MTRPEAIRAILDDGPGAHDNTKAPRAGSSSVPSEFRTIPSMPRPKAALRREGEKALREFVVLASHLISRRGLFRIFRSS